MRSRHIQPEPSQERLALDQPPSFDRGELILYPGNAEAFAAVEAWPDWPDRRLVLVGPARSGKSHLAAIWAERSGAETLPANGDLRPRRHSTLLVEDIDRRPADEALFHLLNLADAGAALLMTARTAPRDWPTTLPDLHSRLNAIRVVELAPPEDDVLLGLLAKFFRERNIRPEADVAPYLIRRIERSASAAYDVVARIDEAAAAGRREVTRTFVREVLDETHATHDLFD